MSFSHRAKEKLRLAIAVGTLVGMIIGAVAWSQEDTATQIRDADLIAKGRYEAQHSQQARDMAVQSAKHDYDFYEVRGVQLEQELQDLEKDVDEGVTLTSSQQRKMRRLEDQVDTFQTKQDEALERLSEAEDDASE